MTVQQVYQAIEDFAPASLAEHWDNVGLLVGDADSEVRGVLCALDITEQVIDEAVRLGANVIVAHHPAIFTSVNYITAQDGTGRILRAAIRHDIALVCMHTNADCAEGGVNDALAACLGLQQIEPMGAGENGLLGRVGRLAAPMQQEDFAAFVKQRLNAGGVRYCRGAGDICCVAVGGGACGKLMDFAKQKGADAFVIGDCSYDLMQRAESIGLMLIDAGHFPTENPICAVFAEVIKKAFPTLSVNISKTHQDCIHFI